MKFLEITTEIEQSLVAAFDAALKSGGMSVLQHVQKVIGAVQVKAEASSPPSEVPGG